jgi:2-dehydropantoate 2-reductase
VKILVVGAGAVGGYFGGRLLAAGRDVTFLVRPRRAAQLSKNGLVIQSPLGDEHVAAPPVVSQETLDATFDLVLVSCKAYDLAAAAASFAPAVGPRTMVLPLLNGMQHLDVLGGTFGDARVLGGMCLISATLDDDGRIRHLNATHELVFGEVAGGPSERVAALAAEFAHARFSGRPSEAVLLDMWEKWVLIASSAGATCLLRGSVGDIVAAEAQAYGTALLDECAAVASAAGFPPRETSFALVRALLTAAGSPLTASMLRDVERRAPTEHAHIIGDLINRAERHGAPPVPLLRLVDAHMRTYEARRAREA